jgi:hypothetical protein
MTESALRAAGAWSVAASQAGLVTRRQLAALGFGSDQVRGHVDAGRWVPYGRKVVALNTGPLDEQQRRWLAVLDGAPRCVLAGISALHVHGLDGFPLERVQAAVPQGARSVRTQTYVRRQSRRVTPQTVHPAKTPPCLRVGPALVDALSHIQLPMRGCALMAAVVQQRLLPAPQLVALVAAEPTLPRRSLYLAVAADIEGGSHSLLELDFVKLSRRAGVSPPRRQVVRVDRAGRRRYLDADFDTFAVEVDGAVHLRPATWWDDMFRQNAVVLSGKPVLRFGSVAVRLHPDKVIEQLQQAHARWPPQVSDS